MGVDCQIGLPDDVRVRDVADVIGIAAGLKATKTPLGGNFLESWAVRVDGVAVKGYADLPECANVELTGPMVDGETQHHCMFHYESDNEMGRLLSPRSTAFWIAVGKRLVDFFGGTLGYQDCDDSEVDYMAARPRLSNHPSDGDDWDRFQEDLWAVLPISKTELADAQQHAAYDQKEG